MKNLNTPKNKAKFFAQYWGQEIVKWNNRSSCRKLTVKDVTDYELQYNWIELKPLSQITDKDAIEVARISKTQYSCTPEIGRAIVWSAVKKYIPKIDLMWDIIDFLRSKGYALPYMGISVEQQIAWGWIRLTSQISDLNSIKA